MNELVAPNLKSNDLCQPSALSRLQASSNSPGSLNDSPVSSSSKHAKAAKQSEDPNSFAYRVLNSPGGGEDSVSDSGKHWQQATAVGVPSATDKLAGNFEKKQAEKVREMSDAVQGTMSYAAVAQNLRHEGPKVRRLAWTFQ